MINVGRTSQLEMALRSNRNEDKTLGRSTRPPSVMKGTTMDEVYKTERYQIFLRMTVFFDECFEKLGYENETLDKMSEMYDNECAYIFNCQDHGHTWEFDHCGLPEHQFCSFCRVQIDEESLQKQHL